MIRLPALLIAAALVAGASYLLVRPEAAPAPDLVAAEARVSSSAVAEPVGRAESAEVERLIRAFEARIRDHTDPIDYKFLGRLYLERARSTGDVASYASAESAFARAVELAPDDEEHVLIGKDRTATTGLVANLTLVHRV